MKALLLVLLLIGSAFSGSFSFTPARSWSQEPIVATVSIKEQGARNIHVTVTFLASEDVSDKVRGSDEYAFFKAAVEFEVRQKILEELLKQNKFSQDSLYSLKTRFDGIVHEIVARGKDVYLGKYLEKKDFSVDASVSGLYLTSLDVDGYTGTRSSYGGW